MSNIENIKDHLDIVGVASDLTELKKSGKTFKGLCPFHQEKTPSFFVYPEKGIFRCFGCGIYGSAIDLVAHIRGISFSQAVSELEKELGLVEKKKSGIPTYCPVKPSVFLDLKLQPKDMRKLYLEDREAYYYILANKIREKWLRYANLASAIQSLSGINAKTKKIMLDVAQKKKNEYWNIWVRHIVKDQERWKKGAELNAVNSGPNKS